MAWAECIASRLNAEVVLGELQVEAVLAKPLDAQCSWMTISPGRGWKSSWNVPPRLSLAKTRALADPSW
ncbi:hypothetical protein GCM10017710_22740 [Arthrobacter ramosus]